MDTRDSDPYRILHAYRVNTLILAAFSIVILLAYTNIFLFLLRQGMILALLCGLLMAGIAFILSRVNWQSISTTVVAVKVIKRFALPSLIALGVILRLTWITFVPPIQFSDFADYDRAAQELLQSGQYYYLYDDVILWAWRPPGLSFTLAALYWLLGNSPYVPSVLNILCFIGTVIVLYKILRVVAGYSSALFGVTIFVVYPGLIAITGLAATEPLALLLYVSLYWIILCSLQYKQSLIYSLVAGALIGFLALVKPIYQFIPLLIFAIQLLYRPVGYRRQFIFLVFAMAVVMTPWIVRNYLIFDELVLVSTNGGDTFYRANNSLASGGYVETVDRNLTPYLVNEIEWNRIGYRWGTTWILHNPSTFLWLAGNKLALFFGNGAAPIGWTLKETYSYSGYGYYLLYGVGHLWWLNLWLFVGASVIKHWQFLAIRPNFLLLIALTSYPIAIHSVFLSHARHHIPIVGFLIILASLWIQSKEVLNSRKYDA